MLLATRELLGSAPPGLPEPDVARLRKHGASLLLWESSAAATGIDVLARHVRRVHSAETPCRCCVCTAEIRHLTVVDEESPSVTPRTGDHFSVVVLPEPLGRGA